MQRHYVMVSYQLCFASTLLECHLNVDNVYCSIMRCRMDLTWRCINRWVSSLGRSRWAAWMKVWVNVVNSWRRLVELFHYTNDIFFQSSRFILSLQNLRRLEIVLSVWIFFFLSFHPHDDKIFAKSFCNFLRDNLWAASSSLTHESGLHKL